MCKLKTELFLIKSTKIEKIENHPILIEWRTQCKYQTWDRRDFKVQEEYC